MGKPKNTRKAVSNITDQFIPFDNNLCEICLPENAINFKIKNIVKYNKEESLEADLKLTINLGRSKKKLSPRLLVHKISIDNTGDNYKELGVITIPATSIEGNQVIFDIDKSGYLKSEYVKKVKGDITILSSIIYLPYGDKTSKEELVFLENKVVQDIFSKRLEEANEYIKEIFNNDMKPLETLEQILVDEKPLDEKISFENLPEEKKEEVQVTELTQEEQEDKVHTLRNILICILACIIAFTLGVAVKGLI